MRGGECEVKNRCCVTYPTAIDAVKKRFGGKNAHGDARK